MITQLIWTIWTLLSTVPRKAVKFNHSLTPYTSFGFVFWFRFYLQRIHLIPGIMLCIWQHQAISRISDDSVRSQWVNDITKWKNKFWKINLQCFYYHFHSRKSIKPHLCVQEKSQTPEGLVLSFHNISIFFLRWTALHDATWSWHLYRYY